MHVGGMELSGIINVSAIVDGARIGRFNLKLLVVSGLLLITDGFDLGAAGFAGPGIMKEFALTGKGLGLLFSSSIAAGFLGPPLFGFLADKFGRKRVIVGGTLLFGCLTLITVTATNFYELVFMRVLAGVALAGMLPIVVTLNCEFAPARFRATLVMLVFTGVTFGGALPGFIAAHFMADCGWRVLFWVGGLVPIILAFVLAYALPESIKYLTLRPERRRELVSILKNLRPDIAIPDTSTFELIGEDNASRFRLGALLEGPLLVLTPLFWVSNFVAVMGVYFMNQLLPTMLTSSGISSADAAMATTLFQVGGTIGSLVSMRFLDRIGLLPVPILFAGAIPLTVLIGMPGWSVPMLFTIIFFAGFCILGAQLGNIGTEGNIYPTYIRSSGIGSMFAAGRIGGGIGPLLGGIALGAGVPLSNIFLALAIPFACGLLATAVATPLYRRHLNVSTGLALDQASGDAIVSVQPRT